MRLPLLRAAALVPLALAAACSVSASSDFAAGAPSDDVGGGGGAAAPTGQRWEAVETEDACGRGGLSYVLVDEVCGRTGQGYAAPNLHAPMFRDGALFGSTLLAVDATFLWSLDLGAAGGIRRHALVGGLGEPVAAAAYGPGELLLASGAEGLVRVDATDPTAPARSGRVELPGFAYDVHVDGDTAYVALGREGLGVVDLASGALLRKIPVPGHAVGVTTRGRHAYVAACTSLAVVDLDAAQVVSQAWPGAAYTTRDGVLTAPAKDVELVGDVAFVAAGRAGAVAIDVRTAEAPTVLGGCTRPEPSFYASGVRGEADKLFVAGGEWGVLAVDTSSPARACTTLTPASSGGEESAGATPTRDAGAGADAGDAGAGACTSRPPWELLAWEEVWAPPPPAKDPIQVLPAGGRVLAFGDARRIGTRAVDVRDTADAALRLVARYDEPRRLVSVAASGGRVVAAGPGGGLFLVGEAGALTRAPSDRDQILRDARLVAFADDGRWVAVSGGRLWAEGHDAPLGAGLESAHDLVAQGPGIVAVALDGGVTTFDLVTGARTPRGIADAHLPLALAPDGRGGLFVAAPEWAAGRRLSGGAATPLPPHGVFDDAEAADTARWRTGVPRRHLASGGELVELATLGREAGLVLHAASGVRRVALPPGTYAGLARDEAHAYAVALDRSLYRSTLVTVALDGGAPQITSTEVFTGGAAGVAAAGGHVFVADADGAVRVYDASGRKPVLSSVLDTKETP